MTRRNQSAAETDAPQDVRARVDEQIEDLTGEQESPAQERQEEQEHQPQPERSQRNSSLNASEHSETALARETRRALELMSDNIRLLFDKHEAQAKKLDETREGLTAITQELRVTADLMQQVIGRHDEQTENLGMQTAALARVEMRLNGLHQTLREHLSKHNHQ